MKATSKSRLRIFAIVVFTAVMCPAPAEAHLNSTGMGPIYDGLMHFLMSPDDLVPVLGVALLAGLCGAAYGRRALFVLPTTWLVGGIAGLAAATTNPSAVVTAATFLLLGGLIAMDASLSLARYYRAGSTDWPLPRIPEWNRNGPARHCFLGTVRTRIRRVCSGRAGRRFRRAATSGMGAHCGASGRQLDRRQRTADAWVGPARQALT